MKHHQLLLKEQSDLKTERERLALEATGVQDAAEAEPRDLTAAESARDDAIVGRIKEINGRLDTLATEVGREELIREALRNAPAQPGRVERIHDRELDRPWGWQWQQLGAKAEIVLAGGFGEQLIAMRRAALGQGTDPRLILEAATGAGEAIPADGGFLVGHEVETDIRLRMFTGEILSRVDRRSLTGPVNGISYNMVDESSRATGSRFGGVQGYWVDEGTAPTATKPTFWRLKLEVSKVAALYRATDELLQDTVELGRTVRDAFGEELKFLCEARILSDGTGGGAPTGVIGHAATVSVAKETGQVASTVVWENVLKMWSRMYAPARAGAVWMINQDVEPQLFQLNQVIGTGGLPVFLPPGGASVLPYSNLFGRPVIPVEYCATLGTVGDIVLVNWLDYRFIDKGEVQHAESMHLYFDTGEQAFRAVYRADGKPKWRTTLTPFKGTNTQAPFVTLATRA